MQNTRKKLKGFTLIEVLVSLFVFTIVMTAASGIFASSFSGYRYSKNIQRDVENAQFIMSILAKELRTSTVVSPTGITNSSSAVQFYDHSQGRCFNYRINGGAIQVASNNAIDAGDCSGMSPSPFTTISTGTVSGSFYIVTSRDIPKRVGRMTLTLNIREGSTHSADIQTTVSLRDFGADGSNF